MVSVTGFDLDNDAVGVVDITVKHRPGTNDVDLETTTVQWTEPSGSFYRLATGGANGNPDGRSTVETVQDDDGSNPVLNDQGDHLKLRLEPGSDESVVTGGQPFGSELGEGESATVRITTASGSQTTTEVLVPETISGTSAVGLYSATDPFGTVLPAAGPTLLQ